MRRRVGRDERAVDNEHQIELRRFGQARLLDIPIDADAGIAGQRGIAPGVLIGADALQDGAEMQLAGLGHHFLLFARRLRPIVATTDNEHC